VPSNSLLHHACVLSVFRWLSLCQFFDVRSKEQRDTAGGTFSLSNKVEAHFVMTLVQVSHAPSVCCVPAPLPARHSLRGFWIPFLVRLLLLFAR
jgi:hypothetical protein